MVRRVVTLADIQAGTARVRLSIGSGRGSGRVRCAGLYVAQGQIIDAADQSEVDPLRLFTLPVLRQDFRREPRIDEGEPPPTATVTPIAPEGPPCPPTLTPSNPPPHHRTP